MELICDECNSREHIDVAVKQNTIEFVTLFPNRKITMNSIHD